MMKSYKTFKRSLLISAAAVALTATAVTPLPSAYASAAASAQSAVIEASVRLRTAPSTDSRVLTYLQRGEQVVILEQTNRYWYKVQRADGTVGYTSTSDQYLSLVPSSSGTGTILAGVNLRNAPSASNSRVIRLLKKGEQVSVLEESNSYFYKVATSTGETGYVSSSSQYISLSGGVPAAPAPAPSPSPPPSPGPAPVPTPGQPASQQIERVINAGMKYLGTPYEYGSNRNSTATFDCSAFIRQMFMDGMNLTLPSDSRKQGDWIKANSSTVNSISGLKRGDLVFFMSYKGTSASAYAGVNKSNERITHVAMYLGNGQLLHTYSQASGGVKLDKLDGHWVHRFLFGGSVVQ